VTEQVRDWLHLCDSEHETCRANAGLAAASSRRPARLLHVVPAGLDNDVRLIQFDQASGPYAALSYCWGSSPHAATTTSTNLDLRVRSISMADLPITFRDAILFCRQMGVRFLWIDALCIIQPRYTSLSGGKRLYLTYDRQLTRFSFISLDQVTSKDTEIGKTKVF
jgi:hypothetical protein